MKDFSLDLNNTGTVLELSYDEENTIVNNIALSLEVRKGMWWFDSDFGLEWDRRAKLTDATADLLRQRCLQALQWILDLGRATSIEVETERLGTDRINILVVAVQTDGQQVEYETFVEVA